MTNLLTVLPDFDLQPHTHILPSLERALISTADILTLDALDVAKRAQVPPGEVKKLAAALLEGLNVSTSSLPVAHSAASGDHEITAGAANGETPSHPSAAISTLDHRLDAALGCGIAVGNVTEFVGESAAGKTQILLTLLLSVQLPVPAGVEKSALYISTEAPLQTSRLSQILNAHPKLSALPEKERPSLDRIQSTHIHDLESQDHILRFQVPLVIERHNIGLLVVDSIAANYRPEFDKGKVRKSAAESFVKRSNQVTQLGTLLRDIAKTHNVAVVVANQVSDRFMAVDAPSQIPPSQQTQKSRPGSPPLTVPSVTGTMSQALPTDIPTASSLLSTDDPLSLDHQQRFFTGWGDGLSMANLKTPSLGLAWTNQLATRVALLKQPIYEIRPYTPGEEPNISGWKRTFKVVFSTASADSETDFEIAEGGVRSIVHDS